MSNCSGYASAHPKIEKNPKKLNSYKNEMKTKVPAGWSGRLFYNRS